MNGPPPRFWPIFFELYESLPRQGPGNRACAARALAFCRDLPPTPAVLDLGCGVGGQTLHLAELTSGPIVAVDSHAPSIERLRATVAVRGLADRIRPMVGDMAKPGLPPASVDLVWSEGALYNIGIENALRVCRGCCALAVTSPSPTRYGAGRTRRPRSKRASTWTTRPWAELPDVLATIDKSGFSLIGHFTLPDEAWWDDFYTPMKIRIEELRGKYADDDEALAVLDQLAQEPEMHQRYSDCYAYEFFVLRRKG
jgi:SAM-dependent methyltransferase